MTIGTNIVKTLPGIVGLLFVSVLSGCSSGESPAPDSESMPSMEGVVQDELSFASFCGGSSNKQCSDDRVCVPILTLACPGPKVTGLCVKKPDHCPAISDPVCGCDGKTYTNVCQAVHAGTAFDHRGACSPPKTCEQGGSTCPGAGTCVKHDDDDDQGHDCKAFGVLFGHHDDSHQAGVCECNTTVTCGTGQRFNDDPAVCACETVTDPCDGVACRAGDMCITGPDGAALCVPDPCSGVACRAGEMCVSHTDGTATCEPDPCSSIACRAGQTCQVVGGAAVCM